MIISDLNYLETAVSNVTGGWGKRRKKHFSIKQVNFNYTDQDAKAVSFNKFSKFSVAVAQNDNETYQYNG